MSFNMNFNLKGREIKLIYILIILLGVFGVFKLLSTFFPETILVKQELDEIRLEKESILLTLYEVQELNAKNDLLELKLHRLKDKFILKSEDAAYVMSHGHGDGILIKSIIPRDVSDSNYYYTSTYSIDIEGAYSDIVNFISKLEQKPVSKIVGMDLNLNVVDMNVQGSIIWEIYSLHERKTPMIPAPVHDHGRPDPFQVPREYMNFLYDFIHDEVPDEIEKENQNLKEIVRENTLEDDNEIEFFHKSTYKFPIKQ